MKRGLGRSGGGRLFIAAGAALICVALVIAGCRSGGTVKTETYSAHGGEERTVVVKEKTVIKDDSGGILGTAFRLIGKVVAFPFEVLGLAFDKVL
ncbi:MAG: hypothetical protein PHN82_00305 [bacterium]|nr:hypothetical protein [bacterium]